MREEDMTHLSPFVNRHLGVHGTCTFALPDLAPGAIRELRDPDAPDEHDEQGTRWRPAWRVPGQRGGRGSRAVSWALMRWASASWSSRMMMRQAASSGLPWSTSSRARAASRSW